VSPSDIPTLLGAYDRGFQAKFSEKAPIVPGKDAKLAKELIARYGMERLQAWLVRFWATTDPFIIQMGYTFSAFYMGIGKMITAKQAAPPRVEPTEAHIAHVTAIQEAQKAAEQAAQAIPPPKPPRQYITKEQHAEVLRQLAETKARLFGKEM